MSIKWKEDLNIIPLDSPEMIKQRTTSMDNMKFPSIQKSIVEDNSCEHAAIDVRPLKKLKALNIAITRILSAQKFDKN